MTSAPGIVQTIVPVTHNLGAFQVRRAIPSRERTMVCLLYTSPSPRDS